MFQALKDLSNTLIELRTARRRFDYSYYRRTYPDFTNLSDRQLLVQYCMLGWREGRDPAPDFSTSRYLRAYPDVAAAQINPFVHFLAKGEKEGRKGWPEFPEDVELARLEPHFDAGYYRACNPDLAHLSDQKLLEHFHLTGWGEGRDPTPDFSVEKYLEDNRDVANARIDPYLHFLTQGRAENRQAFRPLPRSWGHLTEAQIGRLAEKFDADFYRKSSADLTGTPRELLAHYIDTGWKKGHDPSPEFSSAFYENTYGDTKGVCPLIHFVLADYPNARRAAADMPQRFIYSQDAVTVPHRLVSVLKMGDQHKAVKPPAVLDPENGLDLHWVVPDFPKGSGGHMTIFRMIRHLEQFGHRSTIWIEQPIFHKTTDDAYDDIIKYFQCVESDVRFVDDGFFQTRGDVVIATGWTTAYYVDAARGFAGKYYFIQDHEPEFYPAGTERLLTSQTYDFDLACICASSWLAQIMREEYRRWSRGFDLAYDHDVYSNRRDAPDFEHKITRSNERLKIAVYAREHTARRCVHLALMGLELLGQRRDDFEVHLFGQDEMPFRETPFRAYNHGVLDDKTLAQLYNECDLGLCFSATNYSLVPQEMMACGLPVTELEGQSTRAIFPPDAVTLVGPGPLSICEGISALLDDPARRKAQQAAAADWVRAFDWETSAREIESALLGYLHETKKIASTPAVIPSRDLMLDVVIPTFNGIGEVETVIEALRTQRLRDNIQIHCIDSSSSDGTTEWLKDQPDIALTVIDQAEFQHGRTRNQAAAAGNAPLIAFLTQDATPIGAGWATDIVKMMRHYPRAAGLFGRHAPYPHHALRVRQDITGHFRNMLHHPLAVSRDTDRVRWQSEDPAWRQFLHFYSDNNSAMRRSIWQDIPYPEVAYGEDQLWAKQIIEAGHTKLYAPTAAVYHSHDFTPQQAYERSRTEGQFFYTYFGYELGEGSREDLEGRLRLAQEALVSWARTYHVAQDELQRQQDIIAHKFHGWRAGRIEAQEAAMATSQNGLL